jgi:SAM-dependent methyltransferase
VRKIPKSTQKFAHLPPRTGIPFEGFEFARIKSRLPVAEQLEDFLEQCKQSNSVNVSLIRAEWGEGKTDAYERYLEPKITKEESYCYLISTSTIALHLEKMKETFPHGGTTAASFLAAVFAALKDELRSRQQESANVPDYTGYSDPLEYTHAVLKKHLENTDSKLFLFVDEFEEILNHPEMIQRFALSGIKELINGQLGIVHSGGTFSGRLHIIVAVTPYAYGKMHDDRELLQIFGSFASRPSTIDLPQIGRYEAFGFLMDLLRYSYDNSLPEPLPFQSAGILNTIAAISQRNMRALVQIYVDVMTSAVQKNSVKIIDADRLIDTLVDKELAVYGELRPCVDGELLARIEATLRSNKVRGQQCVAVFRLLVGEFKPFSVEEIKTRLGLLGDADVHAVVDIINQELAKLGIPRAIMRLNPPKREVSWASIRGEIAFGGEDILLVENKLPVQSFEDSLVHMEFKEDGSFEETIYLPYDEADLKDLFDVSDSDASFLVNKIVRHFEETARQRRFIISRQLAEQIFPSPTWVLIDFIAERSKRAELWREAAKNFGERLWQLRDLAIQVINYSSRVRIQPTGMAQAVYETQYNLGGGRIIPIRTHVDATTSVTETDVNESVKAMGSKGANMGIIIHTGDIEDQARHLISSNPQLMTLQVRRARALQLLVLSLAREKNLEVRSSTLDARLRDVFHEFDFEKLLDQWVRRLREDGLLIDGLTTRYGRSDKVLADALTFSINHLGESLSAPELFESIAELRSFTFYRQNTRFAPIDIETIEELEKYLEDLVTNGFLKKEGNEFSVLESRVEERILKMLRTRPLSPDTLRGRFVIFSPNDKILEQVYLPTLERKGLVSIEDEVALHDARVVLRSANEVFQKYDARISALRNTRWWSYALLCVSKEREDRFIRIEDFDAYVRKLHKSLQEDETVQSQSLLFQLCHLISALLAHFDQTLAKRVDEALSNGESYVSKATETLKDVLGKLSLLVQEYNRYCEERTYTTNDVEELTALNELKERMTTINDATFSKDTVTTELQALRRRLARGEKPHFFFGREQEEADYYNLKVKQLRELSDRFEAKATSATITADQIENRIQNVESAGTKAKGRLATYRVDKVYALTFAFLTKISEFHAVPLKAELSTGLTLSMLSQFFDRLHETLAEFSEKINQGLNILDDILKEEKSISMSLGSVEKRMTSVVAFFDLEDDLSIAAKQLVQLVAKTKDDYTTQKATSIAAIQTVKTLDNVMDLCRKISRSLTDIDRKFSPIENEFARLKTKCISSLDDYLANASKLIDVLNAAGVSASPLLITLGELVSEAKAVIDKVFESQPAPWVWSKMWEELYAFRDQLYAESKKILSPLEFKVLYLLVSTAGKGAWLVTEQIIRVISEEQKLEKPKVEQAVRSLIQKGLLKEGISLAI